MAEKYQSMLKETAGLDFPKDSEFNLDTKVTVYVPSTLFDKPISQADFHARINNTQGYLTDLFGGTTKLAGIGTYRTKDGKLIGENVAKIETFIKYGDYLKKDSTLKNWLEKKKKEWQQESLGFEFESPKHPQSRMFFI